MCLEWANKIRGNLLWLACWRLFFQHYIAVLVVGIGNNDPSYDQTLLQSTKIDSNKLTDKISQYYNKYCYKQMLHNRFYWFNSLFSSNIVTK